VPASIYLVRQQAVHDHGAAVSANLDNQGLRLDDYA
jgi:hypothetical protein